jgi:ribosomal protein L22
MADEEKPKRKPAARKKTSESSEKPKRTRAASTRKTAASKEEKPKRAKAQPKAAPKEKAEEKPKPRRRTTTRRAKKPAAAKQPQAAAEEKPEAAAEEKPTPKAPARKAAPKGKAPARAPVVTARAKYVRSSARKARLVIDHVRGRPIGEARALLRHSPRGVARDLERLLDSAIANAENNHDLVGDDLYVKEIYADEGPTLKRFRARAQGRAYRIRKRTSHLTVALTPKE